MTKEKIIEFLECLLLRSDISLDEDCRQAIKEAIEIIREVL